MKIIIEGSAEEVLDILSVLKPHVPYEPKFETKSCFYDANNDADDNHFNLKYISKSQNGAVTACLLDAAILRQQIQH